MTERLDVAIVGLGLMGGSLARALTRRGWCVLGIDRPAVLRQARAARAVTHVDSDAVTALEAPLIVLAAPPRANVALLRRLAPQVGPKTVITDLGSVKQPIVRVAQALGLQTFVGGHPMTGRERAGFAASDGALFRGHTWILTPDGATAAAVRAVRALVREVGARVHVMAPGDHDRTMAFVSHMPQLVAWAIAGASHDDTIAARHLKLAGPGFRDMTRLARSPRPLWREILAENRDEVARSLSAFTRALRRRI
jgi:prephenate dehydrogenase